MTLSQHNKYFNLISDIYAIIKDNKLKYLYNGYDELILSSNKYLENIEYIINLVLISLEPDKLDNLTKWFDKTLSEYNKINDSKDDSNLYKYYDDLLSWFTIKNNILDKIISNTEITKI